MIFSYRRVGIQINFPSLSPLSRKCFKLTNKLARENENDFALVINGRLKNARKISLKITSNQSFMSAKWESLAIPSSSSPFSLIHLRFHDWILQFHTSSVFSHYHDHEHRRHREVPTKIFISSIFTAKPAPLRNCTLRPYSSPSSSMAAVLSNSSSNLPFHVGGNQIVNGGQQNSAKELNYITSEYVKDKNLVENRKKASGSVSGNNMQQHHSGKSMQQNFYHQQRQQQRNNNSHTAVR